MPSDSETVVYFDGRFIPESEARISIFDSGFTRGDAAFDAARTFAGRPFQLEAHVDRLLQSCDVLRLKPSASRAKLIEIGVELADLNQKLISPFGDFWIDYRVTRGVHRAHHGTEGSTIVVCDPIPFRQRAPLFRSGINVVTPSVRRTPFWAVSPRVKSHNYLNFVMAELELKQSAPDAWALLLDERGNLAEGSNSNVFLVRGRELFTPREQFVLPGITRSNVMRLARALSLTVTETDLDLRDAYLADEIFLTSTSLCLGGVASINGRLVKGGAFGPVTSELLAAFGKEAGLDIRGQYLQHLE